jgi:hypothetical protein
MDNKRARKTYNCESEYVYALPRLLAHLTFLNPQPVEGSRSNVTELVWALTFALSYACSNSLLTSLSQRISDPCQPCVKRGIIDQCIFIDTAAAPRSNKRARRPKTVQEQEQQQEEQGREGRGDGSRSAPPGPSSEDTSEGYVLQILSERSERAAPEVTSPRGLLSRAS